MVGALSLESQKGPGKAQQRAHRPDERGPSSKSHETCSGAAGLTARWVWLKILSGQIRPVTPRAAAHQDPLSVGFSRQGHWNGLPFPSPGDLPHPGIKLRSPTLQEYFFLPSEPPGKPPCEEKQWPNSTASEVTAANKNF